jgi:hypothetical protein
MQVVVVISIIELTNKNLNLKLKYYLFTLINANDFLKIILIVI